MVKEYSQLINSFGERTRPACHANRLDSRKLRRASRPLKHAGGVCSPLGDEF